MQDSALLLGLITKRQSFALPGTDLTGEFRTVPTEKEAKAMAAAKDDLAKDKLTGDLYWTSYYEDCAVLTVSMVDGDRQLFDSARLLRASLAKEQVDYLAMAYKDFLKSVMPKYDELDDAKTDALVHDFLAQKKNPDEWVSSGNLRECRKLVPSLVNHMLRLMSVSGASYSSLNERLTITTPPTRQRP